MQSSLFPVLVSEIAKRKIKKKSVAHAAGISYKALYNKMNGLAPFTLDEALAVRKTFFPDISTDDLFAKDT